MNIPEAVVIGNEAVFIGNGPNGPIHLVRGLPPAPPPIVCEPMRDLRSNISMTVRLTRDEHVAKFGAVHALGIPSVAELTDKWAGKTLMIAGGGPSLARSFNDFSYAISSRRNDVCVMALNKTHDWLAYGQRDTRRPNRWLRHPIVPEFAMMLDPKDWCASYMTPHAKPLYLFGTSVSPHVWEKFKAARNRGTSSRVYQFYSLYECQDGSGRENDMDEVIQRHRPTSFAALAGGSNVGMRALNMASLLGFTAVELWGFDSCCAPGAKFGEPQTLYAYDKPSVEDNYRPITIESKADKAQFRCVTNGSMAMQITQFAGIVKELEELQPGFHAPKHRTCIWASYHGGKQWKTRRPMRLRVAGDGAIPWMAWKDGGPGVVMEHTHPERMSAKYGAARYWDYTGDRELMEVAA